MAPTVSALRNQIRVATGRYEREVSSAFTKEALAAICDAVDADVDTNSIPPKSEMRAAIHVAIGDAESFTPKDHESPFRKAQLQAIADTIET